uniref:PCQ3_91 n=1 Tax=Streptomyces sp. W9 TaxID=682410 RepID=D0UZE0_9ACTN|nr:hypothetical protein [Streptomyces sp. W9]ACX85592.1 pCQ3_91 [Streptomyces sp. W9]
MSIQTIAPHHTSDPTPGGYLDGELAAHTGLSARRAHARAAMAHTYDPQWATAFLAGYQAATYQAHAATETDPGRRAAWRMLANLDDQD